MLSIAFFFSSWLHVRMFFSGIYSGHDACKDVGLSFLDI